MLLLEQDTISKKQVEIAIKLDKNDSKEYEIEASCDSKIYAKELDSSYLPSFYYLIL